MDTLSHDIAVAEKDGNYSDAIRDLYGDPNFTVNLEQSEVIFTNPFTKAQCLVHTLKVDRGMSWEVALERLSQAQKEVGEAFKGGFYETKNMVPGRNATGWMMAIQKDPERPGEYHVWRPNTGASQSLLTSDDLKIKYHKRDEEMAEKAWRRIYDQSLTWDEAADKGARALAVNILAGSLIPIWDVVHDVVQRASLRGGHGVTASQADMKVVRISPPPHTHTETHTHTHSLSLSLSHTHTHTHTQVVRISQSSNSQSFIGLRLPKTVIAQVRRKLEEESKLISGTALRVTMDPSTLALVPVQMCQHFASVGDYKGKAIIGATPCDIILRFANGVLTLGIPHDDKWLHVPAPKGPNGEYVTPYPFVVAVPTAAGDTSVKGNKIEETTAINERELKKALTPAPTMLSFFKKESKDPSVTGSVEGGSSKDCGGDGVADAGAQKKRGLEGHLDPSAALSSQASGASKKARSTASSVKTKKGGIGSFFGGGKAVGAAQGKKRGVCGTNGGGEETAVLDLTAEDSD